MVQSSAAMGRASVAKKRPGPSRPGFGTFGGVFTPTLLTILGVIMYLRLPWVVGNAGIVGGALVIGLSVAITTTTGLSLSSIATNTRLGTGGPYAVISKTLGLEIGGAVGFPLFVSQALAVAMYIFGFRAGYLWVFPEHDPLWVDLGAFAVVFVVAYISAGLAFKLQYVVMAIIFASLISIFANWHVWLSGQPLEPWGTYPGAPEEGFKGTDFWGVFAVFFPAATGILAGANMSGELADPRRSIPRGTLTAIGVSTVVYFLLALWSAKAGTADELARNYTILIDKALYGPIVLAGLLGATFSSALSSLVGAPRILLALAQDGLVPRGAAMAKVARNGEPRNALVFTGLIVILALMMRNLNVIAPLIAMFFLITYAVVNVVMLVESSLGLVSFRPTLRLPVWVPAVGTVGCVFVMFIVGPTFSLIASGLVLVLYYWIMHQHLTRRREDVRSGIFVAFAEWAANKVSELGISTSRAWKPNFMIPVLDGAELRGEFHLVADLCQPSGSAKLLGIATESTVGDLTPRISQLGEALRERHVFATWSVIDSAGYRAGTIAALQALQSAFFRPNVLLLNLQTDPERLKDLSAITYEAHRLGVGVCLLATHAKAGMGRQEVVNAWIRPPEPGDSVEAWLQRGNMNLGILSAYRLRRAWQGQLNVISVVAQDSDVERVTAMLDELRELCRLPDSSASIVLVGAFESSLGQVEQSDLDVMGLSEPVDMEFVRRMLELTGSSCLFTRDSGNESALV